MTTIDIIRRSDGTYAITVNGKVVAAGLLTNAAAWREAERLVETSTAEDGFGGPNGGGDRAHHHC